MSKRVFKALRGAAFFLALVFASACALTAVSCSSSSSSQPTTGQVSISVVSS